MVTSLLEGVVNAYRSFISSLPDEVGTLINLFLLVLVVVLYVYFFIYKFYSFIGTKNVIGLDLSKYNTFEHPVMSKLTGAALYFVEYILILPFLITFWFSVFAIFLTLLTENGDMHNIFVISAAIVGAVRMISFVPKGGEAAAKEGAKLIPITLLGIAITTQGAFEFDKIIAHLDMLPQFIGQILIFIGFIVGLEIVLRFFEMMFILTGLYSEQAVEKKEAKEETKEQEVETE